MNIKFNRTAGNALIILLLIPLGLALVFGVWAFIAWLVMLLWNFLATSLFEVKTITFWQSFAIIALLSIIGGFFKKSVTVKKE